MKVKVRVIPNAKTTEWNGYREDELILRVSAPAVEGKANKAAIDFMSSYLGISRSAISVVSGETSRHKIFQIVGLESGDLEKKLRETPRSNAK